MHALCTRHARHAWPLHVQARLRLDDEELRHCVRRLPALLGYSHEANVAPKLERLQADLGLSDAELRQMVLAFPALVALSYAANVKPKLAFLRSAGLSDAGLKASVVGFPPLLAYSLPGRIKPRVLRAKRAGMPPTAALARIALTDGRFEAWFARASRHASPEAELQWLQRVSRERFALWNSDNPAVQAMLAPHSRSREVDS